MYFKMNVSSRLHPFCNLTNVFFFFCISLEGINFRGSINALDRTYLCKLIRKEKLDRYARTYDRKTIKALYPVCKAAAL